METDEEGAFGQIWIDALDERDISALEAAVSVTVFGHTIKDILASVATLDSQLWRGTKGEDHFVLVTQIFQHPGGRELRIWSVGGSGYFKMLDNAYEVLEAYAKEIGAKWITGLVKREGFEKMYKRFNYKDVHRHWIVEIEDVSSPQH